MWIIASLYIICIIVSIILYFIACSKIGKNENNEENLNYLDSIKLFKFSFGILILGFLFLTLGVIIRIIV